MAMRFRLFSLLILGGLFAPLHAQHEGHDMSGMDGMQMSSWHWMLQAIPLVTRANPSAGGATKTQLALTQTLAMIRGAWWDGHASLSVTLNAEGLTMPDGELNTGAAGEGFVDKRHPHTYLHELVGNLQGSTGALRFSVSAGRGFAPFGTDDPMMRPFAKYPLNHHLSQILERAVALGSLRVGPAIVEGGYFNGDEPTGPSSMPTYSRFGDSWAYRGTIVPAGGVEVQYSRALVVSPEEVSGAGLDQKKQSMSVRYQAVGGLYLLAEGSQSQEYDRQRRADTYRTSSALIETAYPLGRFVFGARQERTDRVEEDRLADPFRTPRPASDLSNNGINTWDVSTLHLDVPSVTYGWLRGVPFVEAAYLHARSSGFVAFSPQRLYGTSRFWMLTTGMALRAGTGHTRMGRYGVAVTP